MLGILIALALSWAILHFLFKGNLEALGLTPNGKRLGEFFLGMLISILLALGMQYLKWIFTGGSYVLSKEGPWQVAIHGLFLDFKSVFTEELMFRGVLFYALIRKLNLNWALAISSISFGVYHWFSYGIFGQLIPMIFVGAGTAFMGFVWGKAFLRTRSMYLPIALHLGWNFFHNTIIGQGPWGTGIWTLEGAEQASPNWIGLINLFGIPLIVWGLLNFWPSIDDELKDKRFKNGI